MALILKKLLKNPDEFDINVQLLEQDELEKVIEYASKKYYNKESVISDEQFDYMMDYLKEAFPGSNIIGQIGAPPSKDVKKVDLDYWLGSMEKIKPDTGLLEKWIIKYDPPYNISDKLDGVSCLIVYKNDGKISLATRGTATVGTDITPICKYLNLPSFEKVQKYCLKNKIQGEKNLIAFRGELVIKKQVFEDKLASKYSNPRNTVSGVVTAKKPDINVLKLIDFVAYEVVDPFYPINKQLEIIENIGFNTVYNISYKKQLTYEDLSDYLKKRKEKSDYNIDGIIVTSEKNNVRNVKGNPDYAFAYKDVFEIVETTVKYVEWNESKDGYLAPKIVIDRVKIEVDIDNVTGNNAKFIVDNVIGKGSKVQVIRSGDVIPKIHKVLSKSTSGKPDLPKDVKYHWSENKTFFIIDDVENSDNVLVKRIYYWFKTLDTKGLGPKNVENLVDAGFKTIKSIMEAKPSDFVVKAGLGAKVSLNIVEGIKAAMQNQPLERIMTASNKLGHGIGEERLKLMLDKYPNIMDIYKKWDKKQFVNNLKEINGFGDELSNMIADNFSNFVEFYNDIKHLVSIKKEEKKEIKQNKYTGSIFVFTGFRDKELKEQLESMGAKVGDSVSSKTNYVIVASKDDIDNPKEKVKKALELKIKIMTKDELLKSL